MDYSICKALSYNMEDMPVALVMYDIMCQYRVNFQAGLQRVQSSLCQAPWSSALVLDYFIFMAIKIPAFPDIHLVSFPEQSRSMEKSLKHSGPL
jgi:hypothetical protein